MTPFRRVAIPIVVLGAIALLSGCTAVSHISAKLSGASVSFADCDDLKPTKLEIQVADASASYLKYKTVWVAAGASALEPRTVVQFGQAPSSFKTSKGPSDFVIATSRIDVFFEATSGRDSGGSSQIVIDGKKLVRGHWLNWEGNLVARPCDG